MESVPEHLFTLLQRHTSTVEDSSPMGVVHLAVVLAGTEPTSVESAASRTSDDDLTRWTFDLIVDGALAHGVVDYDRAEFGWEDELARFGPSPTKTVREAWVRPLATVTQLAVDDVWRGQGGIYVGGVTLSFADGSTHRLPGQERRYRHDEAARADAFFEALRSGIGY